MIPVLGAQAEGKRSPPTSGAPKQGRPRQEDQGAKDAQGGPPTQAREGPPQRGDPDPSPGGGGATRRPDPEREGERGGTTK